MRLLTAADRLAQVGGRGAGGGQRAEGGRGAEGEQDGGGQVAHLRWGAAGRGLGSSYDRLCRDIDRLDEELLNTAVDPALLHRTVETSRRQNVRAGGGGPAAASASPR